MTLFERLARCFSVSVGTTLLSAAVLVALSLGAGVAAGIANVVAVACGIVPSYLANRHWVWKRSGRGALTREILPFWALALAGLATSTLAVAWTARMTAGWPDSTRALALPAANLTVFASLWVVQFVLLDRVLFRAPEKEVVA